MTTDELKKRFDEELAQLHTRVDDLERKIDEVDDKLSAIINEWNDRQLERIHDLKNTIEGHRFRIESLEKHPPLIPVRPPSDQTGKNPSPE